MENKLVLKTGRKALDPLNRVVEIVYIMGPLVVVKLAGSYGATIHYPASVLRPPPDGE